MWLQRRGYIENDFTVEIISKLVSMIKAGDVLLSYESGRWTSLFIKGEWDHAAIVDHNLYVVEAVGDNFVNGKNIGGVRKVRLEEWLWKKKHIAVLRLDDNEIAVLAAVISNKQLGKSYDHSFSIDDIKKPEDDETLYCSELVYVCFYPYMKTFLKHVPKKKEILPIDYLNEPSLRVIYNSRVWLNP